MASIKDIPPYGWSLRDRVGIAILSALSRVLTSKAYRRRLTYFIHAGMRAHFPEAHLSDGQVETDRTTIGPDSTC